MRRLGPLIATALVISSCSTFLRTAQRGSQATPTWAPATGTVLAQTAYGRIRSEGSGGFRIELRETPLPVDRSDAERAVGIAAIREFAGTSDLALTYRGLQRHPENTGIAVELYDSGKAEFMVDVHTNSVVYMQTTAPSRGTSTAGRLTAAQLEERVRGFLSHQNGCFDRALGQLEFEPGNKGDNYFFRWRSPSADVDRPWNQPTFVQIGIDVYGTIFGYVDSGICYLARK